MYAEADDAAAVLRGLEVASAHVLCFSGGSAVAQELALRHPEVVRSLGLVGTWARPDPYLRRLTDFFDWLMDVAPSERAALEAFFLWIYTPRAHADGMVDQIIEEALAVPSPQPPEAFKRQLEAFMTHDTLDRLHQIQVPTLVVAGQRHPTAQGGVADRSRGVTSSAAGGRAWRRGRGRGRPGPSCAGGAGPG